MTTSGERMAKPRKRRRRFGLIGWLWRMGVGLLILVVGLAGAGLIIQALATWNDQQEFPAPSHLVDVGPLIVVSATAPDDKTRRVWTEINGELAQLSTNGVHDVVDGATHEGLVWEIDDAQVTIDSIRHVLDAVRTGQPLAR